MALKKFNFNVIDEDKYSRTGLISTHRSTIQTPVFMPVGTQATVKAAFINENAWASSNQKYLEALGNLQAKMYVISSLLAQSSGKKR